MDFILIDLERSVQSGKVHYWKANNRGYTTDLNFAGLYTAKETSDAILGDIDKRTVSISKENIDKLMSTIQTEGV